MRGDEGLYDGSVLSVFIHNIMELDMKKIHVMALLLCGWIYEKGRRRAVRSQWQ